MKFLLLGTAALALALAEAAPQMHIRVHVEKANDGAICYKACNPGEYCVRGSNECTKPPSGMCFNPAESVWIKECAPGFVCRNGKCDWAKKSKLTKQDENSEDEGGDTVDAPSDSGSNDPDEADSSLPESKKSVKPRAGRCKDATGHFVSACPSGYACVKGKCSLPSAKKANKLVKQDEDGEASEESGSTDPDDENRGFKVSSAPRSGRCKDPKTNEFVTKCRKGYECYKGKCMPESTKKEKKLVKEDDEEADESAAASEASASEGSASEASASEAASEASGSTDPDDENRQFKTTSSPRSGKCKDLKTNTWVAKCGKGYECLKGKCVLESTKKEKKLVKQDEEGGDDEASGSDDENRALVKGTTAVRSGRCKDTVSNTWVLQCPSGYACVKGKCPLSSAKKSKKLVKEDQDEESEEPEETEDEASESNEETEESTTESEGTSSQDEDTSEDDSESGSSDDQDRADIKRSATRSQPCPKCSEGQYCVHNTGTCSAPPNGKCFNPSTQRWVSKCAGGSKCDNGQCVRSQKAKAEKVIVINLD